jgi:hypothetical protein
MTTGGSFPGDQEAEHELTSQPPPFAKESIEIYLRFSHFHGMVLRHRDIEINSK